MNWWLWIAVFALVSVPIALLLADRMFAVRAPSVIKLGGIPWVAALAALLVYAGVQDEGIFGLVAWGALGGLLGTIALDAVRLAGLRAGAFPMDMPMMFGTISHGLAPRFQRAMIGQMARWLSTLDPQERAAMLRPRLQAIARLAPAQRNAVVGAMAAGVQRLPEERRVAVLDSQGTVMAELGSKERQALMTAMDAAMTGAATYPPYAQPRGLPKIPMARFRQLADQAFPETWREANVSRLSVGLAGYLWHVLNGVSFGIMYTLLVGDGSWGLAIGWGALVWLAMMVVMPPMMPAVGFPRWFPAVPLVAHIAMALPIGWIAISFVSQSDVSAALL